MSSKMIAVGMSVYKNDCPSALKDSIDSILNQSYRKFELFIEVDGTVPSGIKNVLSIFNDCNFVHINFNQNNLGLAHRMNEIISSVKEEFIFFARMDADDIARNDRFIKQVQFLNSHPDIDIVGSDVIEFNNNNSDCFYKKMDSDHESMINNVIKRCPFNHPSVMMRSSVFDVAKYNSSLMNTQDYYLWVDLAVLGYKFSNINEPLLKFRVDENFHSRRGVKKALNDLRSRLYAMKHLRLFTLRNVIHTFALFFLRMSPSYIKKIAYKKLR